VSLANDSTELNDNVAATIAPEIYLPAEPTPSLAKPRRVIRIPARYRDIQPEPSIPFPLQPAAQEPPQYPVIRRVILRLRDTLRTAANSFGVLREYMYRPSYDPEAYISPEDLANPTVSTKDNGEKKYFDDQPPPPPPPWPFANMSVFSIVNWMNTGSTQKSEGEVQRLLDDVIGSQDFRVEDLAGVKIRRENKRLDDARLPGESTPFSGDDWKEVSVDINIPTSVRSANGNGRLFSIPGLHFRSLTAVMKSVFSGQQAKWFHFTPFKRFCHNERTWDELYTSDAWLNAHEKLQQQPNEPGCKLEKAIAGLMFWSDSTHLANFGTAKVWPLYLYFGNLSKYIRGMPNSNACHHIAYIPSVSCFTRHSRPHNSTPYSFLIAFKMSSLGSRPSLGVECRHF
jgi:Plavaka transposase